MPACVKWGEERRWKMWEGVLTEGGREGAQYIHLLCVGEGVGFMLDQAQWTGLVIRIRMCDVTIGFRRFLELLRMGAIVAEMVDLCPRNICKYIQQKAFTRNRPSKQCMY